MKAYQAGIAKFDGMDSQVYGISTDNSPSLRVFAEQTGASFPLLSDFMRTASKQYGVLVESRGIANRSTFVIDMEGKIAFIEEGNTAVDPASAEMACSRLKKK
jgi:peroxiredoxin